MTAATSRAVDTLARFSGQFAQALALRQSISTYQQNADLLAIGAYQPGANPEVDRAISVWPEIQSFLRQRPDEQVSRAESLNALSTLAARAVSPEPEVVGYCVIVCNACRR